MKSSRRETAPHYDRCSLPLEVQRYSGLSMSFYVCGERERERESQRWREKRLCVSLCVRALKFGLTNPIVKNATFVYI